MSESTASVFADSMELRARNLRFRGIGNPFAFLQGIGIVPIKEFIYRGATLIELAEVLNLPVGTLRKWIEENNLQAEIEEASVVSAEGYIAHGEKMLKNAKDDFELKKAKALIEHAKFMASKKDKTTYGNTPDLTTNAAAVMYQFVINQTPQQTPTHIIEGEAVPINLPDEIDQLPEISLDLSQDPLGDTPEHIRTAALHTNISTGEDE